MRLSEITESVVKLDKDKLSKVLTPELQHVHHVFKKEGFDVRLVGGAVRDLVSGVNPKDLDLATDANPDEMMEIFDKHDLHYILTGLQHGTITVVINKVPIEITTLRIDSNHTGRHADVEFTRNWEVDAERRDLTFNAMSLDFNGNLYDYFDGISDLKNNVARFVGDADKRIQEDYLRILRWFRFISKMPKAHFDKDILASVSRNAAGLDNISGERIWSEFAKIITRNSAALILGKMHQTGVDKHIGINLANTIEFTKVRRHTEDVHCLLASLLNNVSELDKLRARWKFDNDVYEYVSWLIENRHKNYSLDDAKEAVVFGVNRNKLFKYFVYNNNRALARSLNNWKEPTFPVSGKDLLNFMNPGPKVGKILRSMKKHWVDSNYTLSKDELLVQFNLGG